ncbi:MAG: SRPBCC family protein [Nocardioidaceae bacterium]
MELSHQFTVPASVEQTWAAFNDIESVAGCFPGAQVTSVEGDDFTGTCKVKLGPIALVYGGSGSFVEKDEAAHRFVVEARGKDKRGNGTAGAKVTATMTGTGASTDVSVVTDLAITGKPAQFGRGVMQDVSDKLLQQFVDCLQGKVGAPAAEPVEAPAAEPAAVPDGSGDSSAAPADQGGTRAEAPPAATSAPTSGSTRPAAADDALDLGATVLPVLARTYWKQALGVLVVALVIWRIIRH